MSPLMDTAPSVLRCESFLEFRPPSAGAFRLMARGPGTGVYVARLARSLADIQAAQALRFQVFNLELQEGLAQSFANGRDEDPFDAVCDHLIIEELDSRELVATYRLQPGFRAASERGYYSAQEFDLAPFEVLRGETVELARACVARRHRNLFTVQLLWRGIAFYARALNARYLVGCSSLGSTDARLGASLYSEMNETRLAAPALRTQPRPECACPLDVLSTTTPEVPRLLAAYFALGARICGPPAIDRQFGTIDFLTVLDLKSLSPRAVSKHLNSPPDFTPGLEFLL